MANSIDKTLSRLSPEQQQKIQQQIGEAKKNIGAIKHEDAGKASLPSDTPSQSKSNPEGLDKAQPNAETQSKIQSVEQGQGNNYEKAELQTSAVGNTSQPNAMDKALAAQQNQQAPPKEGKLNENLLPSEDYKNLNHETEKTASEPVKSQNAIDRTLSPQSKSESKEAGQTLQKSGLEMDR